MERRRALGGHGPGPAVGHLGAAPGRPVRPGHRLAGALAVAEADALEHLVRRYLAGFGPASLGDLGSWAGLPLTTLRPVLERVGTRRFRDEQGGELFDLPDAPLPEEGTPAPPRFLSTWDANLLVHARRTQVLPERHRGRIFHIRAPNSFPTFLVDGAVAGTWRHEEGRVRLEPFEPLGAATRRAAGGRGRAPGRLPPRLAADLVQPGKAARAVGGPKTPPT